MDELPGAAAVRIRVLIPSPSLPRHVGQRRAPAQARAAPAGGRRPRALRRRKLLARQAGRVRPSPPQTQSQTPKTPSRLLADDDRARFAVASRSPDKLVECAAPRGMHEPFQSHAASKGAAVGCACPVWRANGEHAAKVVSSNPTMPWWICIIWLQTS